MKAIKSCPHCGGAASLNRNYSNKSRSYYVFVRCDICGATGKSYYSREDPVDHDWKNIECEDAIKAWNMRVRNEE